MSKIFLIPTDELLKFPNQNDIAAGLAMGKKYEHLCITDPANSLADSGTFATSLATTVGSMDIKNKKIPGLSVEFSKEATSTLAWMFCASKLLKPPADQDEKVLRKRVLAFVGRQPETEAVMNNWLATIPVYTQSRRPTGEEWDKIIALMKSNKKMLGYALINMKRAKCWSVYKTVGNEAMSRLNGRISVLNVAIAAEADVAKKKDLTERLDKTARAAAFCLMEKKRLETEEDLVSQLWPMAWTAKPNFALFEEALALIPIESKIEALNDPTWHGNGRLCSLSGEAFLALIEKFGKTLADSLGMYPAPDGNIYSLLKRMSLEQKKTVCQWLVETKLVDTAVMAKGGLSVTEEDLKKSVGKVTFNWWLVCQYWQNKVNDRAKVTKKGKTSKRVLFTDIVTDINKSGLEKLLDL